MTKIMLLAFSLITAQWAFAKLSDLNSLLENDPGLIFTAKGEPLYLKESPDKSLNVDEDGLSYKVKLEKDGGDSSGVIFSMYPEAPAKDKTRPYKTSNFYAEIKKGEVQNLVDCNETASCLYADDQVCSDILKNTNTKTFPELSALSENCAKLSSYTQLIPLFISPEKKAKLATGINKIKSIRGKLNLKTPLYDMPDDMTAGAKQTAAILATGRFARLCSLVKFAKPDVPASAEAGGHSDKK